ncbi:hypothetical protein [Natranaerofaba carboxydovora]|uniref:hypothetical protein n=1 Tax=Natranaerofaba carboxydovora TaxID=2742683 RepID=UPI001F14074B|nr:hypothetical protein [Natranaerofaba carboxydovora]UMZ72920.1 hypothetical protein ACONDI_00459 [Natranaerofaba carboxydovora]
MSCSSIKQRFDMLINNQGGVNFLEANNLYSDLIGSLDAHRLELQELEQRGDYSRADQLRQHIADGEQMLEYLRSMTLR